MTPNNTPPEPVPSRAPRRRTAFTLVELLVVIGIIAVLVSILLPSLAGARRAAQSAVCASNLRTILQGMQMYASENRNYFPGGPGSSGRHLFKTDWSADGTYNNYNCPDIICVFDWASPIAHYLNMKYDAGGSTTSRVSRFESLRATGVFRCPANDILAVPYSSSGGPSCAVDLMVSYNTSLMFQLMPAGTGGSNGVTQAYPTDNCSPPFGYVPMLTKVGDAARKIFIADGARYCTPTNPPDIDLNYNGSLGGPFSDVGAFTTTSKSWSRSHARGNGGASGTDARIYAYRHGSQGQNKATDAYRFNAGFFDGHVESLGDLEGADPNLWMPRGSSYGLSSYDSMWPDVQNVYGASVASGIQN